LSKVTYNESVKKDFESRKTNGVLFLLSNSTQIPS